MSKKPKSAIMKTYGVPISISLFIVGLIFFIGALMTHQVRPSNHIQTDYDYAQQGYSSYCAHRYSEAVYNFEQATKQINAPEEFWYDLGNAYYQMKKYDQARTAYQKAISMKPGDEDALANYRLAMERGNEVLKTGKANLPKEDHQSPPPTKPKGFWEGFIANLNDFLRQ